MYRDRLYARSPTGDRMEIYMKKLLLFFCIFFIVASLVSCDDDIPVLDNPERGDTVELEGVLYAPSEDGEVYRAVGVAKRQDEYVILSEVNGKPVTAISPSAFYNEDYIKKVTISEGIKTIDNYAFDNCYSLSEIVLPQSLETIGFFSFSDCTSLAELRLPENLKVIEDSAFLRCAALSKIYVEGSKLEKIEKNAFEECGTIEELHIKDVNAWCNIVFETLASNPITFSENVYSGGKFIETINITGVPEVKPYAFYGLKTLKDVTVGEGVELIGNSAFSLCENILTVRLSDSVETIETSAFNGCTSLQTLDIGKGVKYFGGLAFYGCTDIRILKIKDLAAWCGVYFYMDPSGTSNPMRYAKEIRIGGSSEKVTNLVIPDGVTEIAKLAFISFKGESITIPKSVETIVETAFYEVEVETVYYQGSRRDWDKIALGSNNFNMDTEVRFVG